MLRKRLSVLLSLAIFLSLCGCGVSSNAPDTNGNSSISGNESVISNPFEGESTAGGESKPVSHEVSYGFGLHGNEAKYTNENLLAVPMLLKGDETSVDVGVMVYVDGILQEFSTDDSDGYCVMGKFSTSENSEKKLSDLRKSQV